MLRPPPRSTRMDTRFSYTTRFRVMPRSPRLGGSSMPADRTTAIDAQASDCLIRQLDPVFADWDAFADWLAADPAHGDAYDAIASLDADLDALPPTEQPGIAWDSEPVRRPPPPRPRFGGPVPAALVRA